MLFVLALFLQRPAALGQNYTLFGLVTLVVLLGIYILFPHRKINLASAGGRDFGCIVILISIYLIYQSAIALIFGQSNFDSWVKEFIVTIIVISCYGVFLLDESNNIKFFKQFTTVASVLGWSSSITLLCAWLIGLDYLELFRLEINSYDGVGGEAAAGTIYFPLSMTYSPLMGADIFSLYRFSGFFREAGIYQAIAAYCLVLALISKRSYWVVLGLILGIVCTFSTIGLAMLAVAMVAALWIKGRFTLKIFSISALLLGGGGYIALYAPLIGMVAKRDDLAFSASFDERNDALLRGVERFSENPFGYGPFSGTQSNDGITLLTSIGAIGAIGFLIQVLLLSGLRAAPRFQLSTRVAACLPILLTALFSQPIYGAPLIYVLLMIRPEGSVQKMHENSLRNTNL